MKKFTYKKHKKEGQYRSFQKDFTDVKLSGKLVGSIRQLDDGQYRMSLIVEDPTGENCKWKWVSLTAQGKTEQACRNFLNERIDEIQSKFKLHPLND